MSQKKSHKLEGNYEQPFVLIAISCSDNLLKMAWNINKKFEINLKEYEISLQSKEKPEVFFPVFCDHNTSKFLNYNLIANKSTNNFLVKELPNIDYILEISGEYKKKDIDLAISNIKQISGVIAAIEVNVEKIKRKSPFIQL